MNNNQLASAYAVAKILGYDKPIDEFTEFYSQYYSETLKILNSKPAELAKVKAVQNPMRNPNLY